MQYVSTNSSPEERLENILTQISSACARSGRDPREIELVAVAKNHTAEEVTTLADSGLTLIGENRLQEAKAKIPLCPGRLRWHFIGHLQKNKVRAALPLFEMIHSVDSTDLAVQINRIAGELALYPRVLLEVNTGGEASKIGFNPDCLASEIEPLLALDRIQIEGLMTIPPPIAEPENSRPYFARLRALRDQIESELHVRLPHLSMGMSGDFPIAVEEGATFVRVGTALFGPRQPKAQQSSQDD